MNGGLGETSEQDGMLEDGDSSGFHLLRVKSSQCCVCKCVSLCVGGRLHQRRKRRADSLHKLERERRPND